MKRMLFAAAIAIFTVSSAHGFETAHYIAEQTGIDHTYEGGREFFGGGGVATFDCDGDGREDLYLAGGDKPAALYPQCINRRPHAETSTSWATVRCA